MKLKTRQHIYTIALAFCAVSCRKQTVRRGPTDQEYPPLMSVVKMGDPNSALQLTKGFYDVEQNAWRWTMGRFAVALHPPKGSAAKGAELVAELVYPEPLYKWNRGATTVTASVDGKPLGSAACSEPGSCTLRAEIAAPELRGDVVTVDFVLSRYAEAGALETRELGVIAHSIGLQSH